MTLVPLSNNEAAATGFTHKVNISYTDLTDTDTAQTLDLIDVGAGTLVREIAIVLKTAFDFTDASINSLVLEIGDTDPDRLVDGADVSVELAVDGTEVLYSSALANASTATMPYVYIAASTITGTFTCAGGGSPTLAEGSAGEVDIYFSLVELSTLNAD